MFQGFDSIEGVEEYCRDFLSNYSKIILYGYSRVGHTHHWIMVALKKALDSMVIDPKSVLMLDGTSNFSEELFENSLILGNINADDPDGKLPLLDSSDYIMHDHNPGKFIGKREKYSDLVKKGKCVFYRVFRRYSYENESYERVLNKEAHEWSDELKMLSIPWATNLLPNEFQKKHVYPVPKNRDVVFVGTIWKPNEDQITELALACEKYDLRFVHYGKNFTGYTFPVGINAVSFQDYISEEEHQRVQHTTYQLIIICLQGKWKQPEIDMKNQ